MKVTDKLYLSVEGIWESYFMQDFVKGIGNGDLDIEKFRFYMIQDYIYLLDYAKVFALGVIKANDESIMRKFALMVNNILNGEMTIHKGYISRLGVSDEEIQNSKATIENTSYTNYMLWVSQNQGLPELTVSILACSWSYAVIGKRLREVKGLIDHDFYGEWVRGYSSSEYLDGNEEILELVNKLTEGYNENQIENLKEIFINCSKYEYMFWDMCFKCGK